MLIIVRCIKKKCPFESSRVTGSAQACINLRAKHRQVPAEDDGPHYTTLNYRFRSVVAAQ
jgi:hypothetical protein